MGYARLSVCGITVPPTLPYTACLCILSRGCHRGGVLHHPHPARVSCSCQLPGYPPSRLSRCASASPCRPAPPAVGEPAARAAASRSCTRPSSTCVSKGVCTIGKRLYEGHGYCCHCICRYACAAPTMSHPLVPPSLPGATPALGRWPFSLSICSALLLGVYPCVMASSPAAL